MFHRQKILSIFLIFLSLFSPVFVYANPNAVTTIQPTNLIYEGTENFSDWDNAVRYVNGGSVITNSTDTVHTGTSSLKAAGSLYNGARLIKTNLTVGQTVTFTGYLKATADNGNPIYIRTNGTEQNDWNQTQLLPNGAWQQFTLTGIINYTSVDFNVFQINSTTPLYLDDVKIFYGQPSDSQITKTFTYDNNGNLISDGTWTHTWDYNNRLVKSTNGTKTITYAYDSNGNRVSKSDGTNTTYYVNQYYEIENGTVKKNIFAGENKVATIEGTNTYYHHTDHLTGSNVDTDSAGTVVESIDYYPFGQVRVDSKSGSYSNDYKFTGKELDTDTDLYYYGARYYDGKIGRFVGEDNAFWAVGTPALKQITGLSLQQYLSDPQNFNSYSYVKNNPLKYTDPDGQFLDTILDVAFVGYDLYKVGQAFFKGGDTKGEMQSLGLDIAGAAIPGVTGLGTIARAARVANQVDNAVDAGKAVGKINFSFTGRMWTKGAPQNGVKNLMNHFEKHGAEVGAKNATEYYNKTNDFIGAKTTHSFKDPDPRFPNDTIHFNASTNQKAVTDAKGNIKTYHVENRSNKINTYKSIINNK